MKYSLRGLSVTAELLVCVTIVVFTYSRAIITTLEFYISVS